MTNWHWTMPVNGNEPSRDPAHVIDAENSDLVFLFDDFVHEDVGVWQSELFAGARDRPHAPQVRV
jgi:hypothetical protein